MRAVAYCRVSTNKEEQLDSLFSQQRFFREYANKNSLELVGIYADEGKSGTKMKNRTQLLKLLRDAKTAMFEVVLIKDVSRLARNTVDFLTSIRTLKALGIHVIFVNYDQTAQDSSEFMLTMLSAIAQEESANISKRVRFGKRQNAMQGKVPNLVYGYDKIPGDYFQLSVNKDEAEVVRRIFYLYTEEKLGTSRISKLLNKEGTVTKRGCKWSQVAISRILTNPLYIGRVTNGKEEIEDFLTGRRKHYNKENWIITENKTLKIIEESVFYNAEKLMKERKKPVKTGNILAGKYALSRLITCVECGCTYRRLVRTYKNTRISWVCSGHNGKGKAYCKNAISVAEGDLLNRINEYYIGVLRECSPQLRQVIGEYKKHIASGNKISLREEQYQKELAAIEKQKGKYISLYTNDIITLKELKEKTTIIDKKRDWCHGELELLRQQKQSEIAMLDKSKIYQFIETALYGSIQSNDVLSKLLNRIEVDSEGNVDIYLEEYR